MHLRRIKNPFKAEKQWHVKTEEKGYDLIFDTRQEARQYKKLLLQSQKKLQAKIILHEFYDGFLLGDKEVS